DYYCQVWDRFNKYVLF
nr:immunoglobulin light chain junction region [Macaca mulatta]